MATYSGRNALVTVNASTSEATVTEINNWSMTKSAEEIDTTVLGDGWGKSDVGMKSWEVSVSGFCDPNDTTGQGILEAAYESGALLQDIRFYTKYSNEVGETIIYDAPDTASDENAGLRVTSLKIDQSHSNVATIEFTLKGSGPVKRVVETVA